MFKVKTTANYDKTMTCHLAIQLYHSIASFNSFITLFGKTSQKGILHLLESSTCHKFSVMDWFLNSILGDE
jgi:hypothetical protein